MVLELENIETAIPATVLKVNEDGTVDCKASIRKVFPNGVFDLLNGPIPSVPMMKLGGSMAEFSFPSMEGDHVLLLAFSRDATKWRETAEDGDVVPESSSGLSLMDLVAIPLVKASREASAKVRVTKDGDIVFTPASGRRTICDGDLVCRGDVLSIGDVSAKCVEIDDEVSADLAVHLSSHKHPTGVGPSDAPVPGT